MFWEFYFDSLENNLKNCTSEIKYTFKTENWFKKNNFPLTATVYWYKKNLTLFQASSRHWLRLLKANLLKQLTCRCRLVCFVRSGRRGKWTGYRGWGSSSRQRWWRGWRPLGVRERAVRPSTQHNRDYKTRLTVVKAKTVKFCEE